LNKLL